MAKVRNSSTQLPEEVSTKHLCWHKDTKTFTADASDLMLPNGTTHVILVSHWTGARKIATYRGCDQNADGEVVSWRFTTQDGFALVVYND